jgi:hypothetical protein
MLNVPNQQLDAFLRTPGWQMIAAAKYLDHPTVRGVPLAAQAAQPGISESPPAELSSQDLDEILQLPPEEAVAELRRRREARHEPGEPGSLGEMLREWAGVGDETLQAAGHEILDWITPLETREHRSLPADGRDPEDSAPLFAAGVDQLTLVADFPILTATYGFSRVDYAPNTARLNAFPPDRSQRGRTPIYVDEVGADALLLSLDKRRVIRWLEANGFEPALPAGSDPRASQLAYFIQVLTAVRSRQTIPSADPEARMVFGLLHTFSHIAIRQAAVLCGLDRTSLSEYLVPRVLSTAIYCNHRFGATIGALTALFESSVADWFALVDGDRRCVYDPVCSDRGGACHACVHLPETSCRFFNLNLSRAFLFGGTDSVLGEIGVGYFDPRLSAA